MLKSVDQRHRGGGSTPGRGADFLQWNGKRLTTDLNQEAGAPARIFRTVISHCPRRGRAPEVQLDLDESASKLQSVVDRREAHDFCVQAASRSTPFTLRGETRALSF